MPDTLDAAARDELARTIAEALGRMERVLRDSFDADRDWTPELDAQVQAAHDALAALLASVRGAEADTEKAEEALDDEQNAHLETQRALVLLANQLETHSVPFVPAAELATYKARRDVEEFDKLLARGMEAAHQAYDAAKAKRDAARAHPPIQETDADAE